MNKELTEIVMVLDKSGSMGIVKDDTIGGFNQFLKDQKELPGEAVFTFATFDTEYNIINQGSLLENVKELNDETYAPSGMTALLDAVGKTINDVVNRHATVPEEEKPGKVIFVVLTDGAENSSTEFKEVKDIANMVQEREDNGWEVLFLGADIDAWADGGRLGFSKAVSMDKSDMYSNYSKISNFTAMYRSSGEADMATFDMSDDELKTQMGELKKSKK